MILSSTMSCHSFCNQKVRKNKNQICAIAHNLFGFDFFFLFRTPKARSLENKKSFNRSSKSDKYKFC